MAERPGRRPGAAATGGSGPSARRGSADRPGSPRPSAARPGGSSPALRRTTRVPQADAATAPRRSSKVTSRALILLLVLAVLGVSYASSIRAWLNLRSERSSLSAQIAAQQQSIDSLRTQSQRWNDPAYIEAQARLRFGWVMPGERSYRVIGKDGKVLTAGHDSITAPLASSGVAQPPWWAGATGSLTRADARPVARHPVGPDHRHPAKLIGPTADTPSGP